MVEHINILMSVCLILSKLGTRVYRHSALSRGKTVDVFCIYFPLYFSLEFVAPRNKIRRIYPLWRQVAGVVCVLDSYGSMKPSSSNWKALSVLIWIKRVALAELGTNMFTVYHERAPVPSFGILSSTLSSYLFILNRIEFFVVYGVDFFKPMSHHD